MLHHLTARYCWRPGWTAATNPATGAATPGLSPPPSSTDIAGKPGKLPQYKNQTLRVLIRPFKYDALIHLINRLIGLRPPSQLKKYDLLLDSIALQLKLWMEREMQRKFLMSWEWLLELSCIWREDCCNLQLFSEVILSLISSLIFRKLFFPNSSNYWQFWTLRKFKLMDLKIIELLFQRRLNK